MIISTNTHNHIRHETISQENFKNFSNPIQFSDFIQEHFALTGNLTQRGLSRVMDYILFLCFVNDSLALTVSQLFLARECELSIRQVRRILQLLIKHGLITVVSKQHRKLATYLINSLFFFKSVRTENKHLLKNLCDKRLALKKANYEHRKKRAEQDRIESYLEECLAEKNIKPTLNKWTFADNSADEFIPQEQSFFDPSESETYKKCPVKQEGNIYAHTHVREETCDDGFLVSQDEPDWLVAAGRPCEPVVSRKKESETGKTKYIFYFQSILLDQTRNQSTYAPQESSVMQSLYEHTIVPVTAQLNAIRPTIWGQIRLSCYPDEAILYADKQLLATSKPIKDRWRYFRGICEAYCKERKIVVNWQHMFQLAREHALPDEGPFIDPDFMPVKPVQVSRPRFNDKPGTDWQRALQKDEEYKAWSAQRIAATSAKIQEEFKQEDHGKWVERGNMFRQLLGITENGEFVNGSTPEQAVQALCTKRIELPVIEYIPEELCDDNYDPISDPFGDRV